MIRDRNLEPSADAFKTVVSLYVEAGAAETGVEKSSVRMPYTGKVLSAYVRCATITDADDSIRIDLHKNGVSMLGATVDPVAAATTTSLAPTTTTFNSGDLIAVVITTGASDAFTGSVTLTTRPYLGAQERFAAKAAGISITP
jgi:hypothetical protein